MKKLVLISLLFVSLVSFSQNRFVTREIPLGKEMELRGTKMYVNNEQYASYEIKKHLKDNNFKAYSQYKKAKSKSALGGFLFGLGGALFVADAVRITANHEIKNYTSNVRSMTYTGLTLMATSIPILSSRTKKLEQAIATYNSGLKTTSDLDANFNPNVNIVANGNGLGLQITF